MSDQQPMSWRDRFFGSGPGQELTPEAPDADESTRSESTSDDDASQHSAELAPDGAEVAATSVDEHDAHQPLVEHDADRVADSPIEPMVIAPSTLRGPSHSAAHPDDMVRGDVQRDRQDDAASSSLERAELTPADDADLPAGDAPTEAIAATAVPIEPPPLVEPRRPSFGLRRQGDALRDIEVADADAPAPDGGSGPALGGIAAAGTVAAATSPRREAREEREFVEPEPTQAIEQQRTDDSTQAIDYSAHTDPDPGSDTDAHDTRVMDAQAPAPVTSEQRFGTVRDDAHRTSSIPVDDETASATAAGGTPIVLVEEPEPPRRKGARGVGFVVALLATVIFAALFAAAFFAVGYLFDRAFDASETLQSVWLRPSYLLPVIVFFLAYWILTLVVNRAGWWAHVLGGFIVALLVYVAHIGGAYMEAQGGWTGFTALPGIDAQALSQLVLAPLSVLAFVIAREVPVWVGGIVARRGRKAREWNRRSLDEFNAERAERLAAYESA